MNYVTVKLDHYATYEDEKDFVWFVLLFLSLFFLNMSVCQIMFEKK